MADAVNRGLLQPNQPISAISYGLLNVLRQIALPHLRRRQKVYRRLHNACIFHKTAALPPGSLTQRVFARRWAFADPSDEPFASPTGMGSFPPTDCVPDPNIGANFIRDLYEKAADTNGVNPHLIQNAKAISGPTLHNQVYV